MIQPKFTIPELFQHLSFCERNLLEMNINHVWPDSKPVWNKEFFESEEELMLEVNENILQLSKRWTLDDVKYNNEKLLVRFDEKYRFWFLQYLKENPDVTSIFMREYLNHGKIFMVYGEIAQKPNHFILADGDNGKILGSLDGGFHGYELEIVLPHEITTSFIIT